MQQMKLQYQSNDENRILILIYNSTFKRDHEYLNFLSYNFYGRNPSITDGVHRKDNFVEIIPVFSIFSNFFKKKKNNNL